METIILIFAFIGGIGFGISISEPGTKNNQKERMKNE